MASQYSPGSLLQLPAELILAVADSLEITDLNALLRSSRHLSYLLYSKLYRLAIKHTFREHGHQKSPLTWAAEYGILSTVQRLLDAGADVTALVDGLSPFHYAVQNGHADVARLLLDAGANPVELTRNGDVPLVPAAEHGHENTVRLLLEVTHTDTPTERSDYKRALFRAVYFGHISLVRFMLDSDCGWLDLGRDQDLIYQAARAGNCDMLRLLLSYGAKVPPVHRTSTHPLVVAAQNGHREAVQRCSVPISVVRSGHSGVTSRLFQKYGTDLAHPTKDGRTPLQTALEEFSPPDVIHLLLDLGADANIRGAEGSTALHTLVRLGRQDLLKTLLSAGASLSAADDSGNTPLLLAVAVSNAAAAALFIQCGADISVRDKYGRTPLHLAASHTSGAILTMLLDAGADVSVADDDGRIPLHFATSSGSLTMFKAILSRHDKTKADYLVRSRTGRTVLHMAVEAGHLAIVDLLIQRGVDANTSHEGYSPLHAAVANKHPEIADLLLAHGADPLCLDFYGRTPVDWASGDGAMLSRLASHSNYTCMRTNLETRFAVLKESVTGDFYKLAKCLVYMNNGDAALTTFRQAARSRASEDDLRYPMRCSGCRKRLKNSGRCHDLDVCDLADRSPFQAFYSTNAGFAVDATIDGICHGDGHATLWERQLEILIARYY
ncbi:ankyrin repeat-containing domain protein [Aspergillus varians]